MLKLKPVPHSGARQLRARIECVREICVIRPGAVVQRRAVDATDVQNFTFQADHGKQTVRRISGQLSLPLGDATLTPVPVKVGKLGAISSSSPSNTAESIICRKTALRFSIVPPSRFDRHSSANSSRSASVIDTIAGFSAFSRYERRSSSSWRSSSRASIR
jgi:hypothetical protein